MAQHAGGRARLRVVLTHPVSRVLGLADLVSMLGNYLALGALLWMAFERSGGQALGPAALFGIQAVPGLLAGTVGSAWIARLPVRRSGVVTSLCGAVVVLLPLVWDGLWPVLLCTFLLGVVRAVTDPVLTAATAAGVPDRLKGPLIAWGQVSFQVAQVIGFLFGSTLAVAGFEAWALGFDLVTFLVAAALLSRLPNLDEVTLAGQRRRPGDGLRELRRNPIARRFLPAVVAMLAVGAVPETMASSMTGAGWLGPLTVAAAAATAVGTLVLSGRRILVEPRRMLGLALLGPLALAAVGTAQGMGAHPAVLVVATAVLGVSAVWLVGVQTIWARVVPPDQIAQVTAMMVASLMVLEGIGALGVAAIADVAGVPIAYLAVAVGSGALIAWSWLRAPSVAAVEAQADVVRDRVARREPDVLTARQRRRLRALQEWHDQGYRPAGGFVWETSFEYLSLYHRVL